MFFIDDKEDSPDESVIIDEGKGRSTATQETNIGKTGKPISEGKGHNQTGAKSSYCFLYTEISYPNMDFYIVLSK